ncbi:PDZ domain-containing protein 4 [Ditylenchus destructor]|nr:PDZ domain-containing protein 4 [Ditylenchus destructor]
MGKLKLPSTDLMTAFHYFSIIKLDGFDVFHSGLSHGTDSDAEVHNAVTQSADRPSVKMFMFRASQPPAKILEQSLEQELSQLHLEMENIRLECDRLMRSKAQFLGKNMNKHKYCLGVQFSVENGQQVPSSTLLDLMADHLKIDSEVASEAFALWLISPLLEVQLKPHHVAYEVHAKWPVFLRKFSTASEEEIALDEPLLVLRRNFQLTVQNELISCILYWNQTEEAWIIVNIFRPSVIDPSKHELITCQPIKTCCWARSPETANEDDVPLFLLQYPDDSSDSDKSDSPERKVIQTAVSFTLDTRKKEANDNGITVLEESSVEQTATDKLEDAPFVNREVYSKQAAMMEALLNSNVPPPHIIYSPTENPYHTIETPTSVAPNQSQQQPVQFRLPKLLVNFNPAESQLQQPSRMMMQRNSHTGIPAQSALKEVNTRHTMSKNGIIFRPGDMMYTSPDNLAETIALQQRLLRQTMIEQANIIGAAAAASGVDNLRVQSGKHSTTQQKRNENVRAKHCAFETQSNSQNGNNKGDLDQYEWKVKRRADGTRYITRRPLKSRILKAREEQVNKERLGVSTDDDAASELKAGKFWSREERKRHLERAKERKQRHNRMLNEREQANSTDKEILQLSQRKQQRKNSRQLFDRFTTIQEFLAHGVRDPTTHPVGGILSVTTV